jgi:hypothetical protein
MSTVDNSNKEHEAPHHKANVPLPENTIIHITLPLNKPVRIFSPRLAKRAQAADIKVEIIEEEQP